MKRFCLGCLVIRLSRNRQYAMCDTCAGAVQLFLAMQHGFRASAEAEKFTREAVGE